MTDILLNTGETFTSHFSTKRPVFPKYKRAHLSKGLSQPRLYTQVRLKTSKSNYSLCHGPDKNRYYNFLNKIFRHGSKKNQNLEPSSLPLNSFLSVPTVSVFLTLRFHLFAHLCPLTNKFKLCIVMKKTVKFHSIVHNSLLIFENRQIYDKHLGKSSNFSESIMNFTMHLSEI